MDTAKRKLYFWVFFVFDFEAWSESEVLLKEEVIFNEGVSGWGWRFYW
jgi:hypothetical protein